MQGWIKLHRQLLKKAIWKHSTPEQKTILITLLLMADHKENEWEWQGKTFKTRPGQFITSLESIKKASGKNLTIQNVRTALLKFEKHEFLTNESTKTGRLITIINWANYQAVEEAPNIDANNDLTKHQQSTNKELTTNKNVKNVKKGKKVITFVEDSTEMQLALTLKSFILRNHPKARVPDNLQNWAKSFDLMLRVDKRTPDEIAAVMQFSQQDSFWLQNILSAGKLREKYDQLYMRMSKAKGGQQPQAWNALREWLQEGEDE